jgi:hypothetical protein
MIYFKETIVWICFYAEKGACVPVNRVVILWRDFLLRKHLKSFMKATMTNHEAAESS